MRRWLASLSISLYVLGVAFAVPVYVRQRLAPDAWWAVSIAVEAALYLAPMGMWFATIQPLAGMTVAERLKRMFVAGGVLIALLFLALTLPVAFVVFTGGALAPTRALAYLAIWLCVMLFWRRRPRKNRIEAYGRARGLPLDPPAM